MKKYLKFLPIVLIVLVILGLGGSNLYFFKKFQSAEKTLKNPTEAAKVETQELLKKLSKLMELPKGEDPTVATITDVSKLTGQPFFAKAKNGDKVIVYQTAKKAILYDPAANMIVEVAPLNVEASAAGMAPAATPGPVRIALYNGTETVGLTQTFEKNIKTKYPDSEVVLKEKAAKTDYQKVEVVDLTGKAEIAQALAVEFNGEVVGMPIGEKSPEADVLVIIGKPTPTKAPAASPLATQTP